MGALADIAGAYVEEPAYQPRSMYLDTLRPADDKRLMPPPAKRAEDPLWFGSVTTKGIDGAQSQSFSILTNRGDEAKEHMSKIWTTERYMYPTQLHPKETSRPELALNTQDIPGATPAQDAYRSHPRGTNPLQPEYDLPGHSLDWSPQPAPDTFIRDNIDITDIEGASTKQYNRTRPGFTTLGAEDIEGAAPGYRPSYRRHMGTSAGQRDTMGCADINTKSGPVIAPRDGYPDGDVEGSKPRPRTNERPGGDYMDMSLEVDDIRGARTWRQAGNLNDPFARRFDRRQFRATNCTSDISGTSPSSYVSRLPVSHHAAKVAWSDHQRDSAVAAAAVMGGIRTDSTTVRVLKSKLAQQDQDGSGQISASEFKRAVQGSGLNLASAEMWQLQAGLTSGAGLLDYKPFVSALSANATARMASARPQAASGRSSASAGTPSRAGSSGSSRSTYRSSRPASAPGSAASGHRASRPASGRPAAGPSVSAGNTGDTPHSGCSTASAASGYVNPSPPAGRSPRPPSAGPHYASIAEVVATAGRHADSRAKLAAAAQTISYKKAHTSEVGKPKYWFGRMGHTADSVRINQQWRAGTDPTMLGLTQHLSTAGTESTGDNQPVAGRYGSGAAVRPQSAVGAKARSAASGQLRPQRPQSAMPASSTGFTAASRTGAVYRKTIMKAATPLYRPLPTSARYASGQERTSEQVAADIALVRGLM